MPKASSKKGPKYQANAEYVLRTTPIPDDVIPNDASPVLWIKGIERGIETTQDFTKARKFSGNWLNETVWYFELFYVAVIYQQAQAWWKQQQKIHEAATIDSKRSKQRINKKSNPIRGSKPQKPPQAVQRAKGGRKNTRGRSRT